MPLRSLEEQLNPKAHKQNKPINITQQQLQTSDEPLQMNKETKTKQSLQVKELIFQN